VRYHNVIADCEGWHPTRHASEGLGLADHRREAAGLSGLRSRGGRFVFRQLRSIFSGVSLRARARSAATFIAIEAISRRMVGILSLPKFPSGPEFESSARIAIELIR
jgi:hypothetical protein